MRRLIDGALVIERRVQEGAVVLRRIAGRRRIAASLIVNVKRKLPGWQVSTDDRLARLEVRGDRLPRCRATGWGSSGTARP